MYSFLLMGMYLLRIRAWYNITDTAQGGNKIPTSFGFQRLSSHFCRGIKYPRPLEDNQPHLYNPVTDQIVSIDLRIADSIAIGENMERKFIVSLPDCFYKAISILIQTMRMLKVQAKGTKSKTSHRSLNHISLIAADLVTTEERTWSSVCLRVVCSLPCTY